MFKPLFLSSPLANFAAGSVSADRRGGNLPPAGAITKPMLIHILQPLRHILIVQRLDMLLHGAHPAADGVLVGLVAG